MTFVSYAQNFEDIMLWRALGHVEAGFYIDLGAYDAEADSVTRAFYDRGWRGINVEPIPEACARIAAARPRDTTLNLAIGRAAGRAAFHVADSGARGLSTLEAASVTRFEQLGVTSETIEVEVQTLAQLCAAHVEGEIHFLKVDVEGAERAVLEGADFGRWRPWVVLLEATAPMSTEEVHLEWEELLLAAEYRFVCFDGLNRFYVPAERFEALAPHFRLPPNVFDNFVRVGDVGIGHRLVVAEAEVLRVGGLYREALAGLAAMEAKLAACEAAGVAAQAAAAAAVEAAERETAAERGRAAAAEAARDGHKMAAAEARAQSELARQHVEAMLRSTSWRLTAPLRRLKGG